MGRRQHQLVNVERMTAFGALVCHLEGGGCCYALCVEGSATAVLCDVIKLGALLAPCASNSSPARTGILLAGHGKLLL
eukprot:792399-Amphidinium_carterae.1